MLRMGEVLLDDRSLWIVGAAVGLLVMGIGALALWGLERVFGGIG